MVKRVVGTGELQMGGAGREDFVSFRAHVFVSR